MSLAAENFRKKFIIKEKTENNKYGTKVTIGGSYGKKNWRNIQSLIQSLREADYIITAPNKDWEPMQDENGSIKFKGEQNIPITELELNFVNNMLLSDIFVICNPDSYVGYMAYEEFSLAYYSIINKTLSSIPQKFILEEPLSDKDFQYYNEHYDEFRNVFAYKAYREELKKRGKEIQLEHIFFQAPPIGLNYWDDNGNLRENLEYDFFHSPEFEMDRAYYEKGLMIIKENKICYPSTGIYSSSWLDFDWYLNYIWGKINLVREGIKRGVVTIGLDKLLNKDIKKNEMQMQYLKEKKIEQEIR